MVIARGILQERVVLVIVDSSSVVGTYSIISLMNSSMDIYIF